MDNYCRVEGNIMYLAVKVLPGASKTEFAGTQEGQLRVRVAAAPEDGKANAELIAFLAKALSCPKRELILLRGEKSRHKIIAVPLACGIQLAKIIGEIQAQ